MKDKHLDRIKQVKRISRIETGGPHGKAGAHVDKQERRVRHMGTREWLEEADEDRALEEQIEKSERRWEEERERVKCSMCGKLVPIYTAHLHDGKLIGDECCWDERLKITE
jgi:formylmethanofuran dehydrogenase subunit E